MIRELLEARLEEKFSLHQRFLNGQMVRMLKAIGFDRTYVRAEGPYLYDEEGNRYLDLLSGFGVFALGRNHPRVKALLEEILRLDLPDLVQLDVSPLAGIVAEKIVATTPEPLTRVFFCNSGTEAVEAAIKFARLTTKRSRILYCEHAFHGLTMGSLSLNGDEIFREGFGPLLPDCHSVPFGDLEALDRALCEAPTAAFFVEPIQGKGVNVPPPGYLKEAAALCRKHGALFVVDEIQTGLGRTGKMWAIDHEGVEPDMLLMAKALSGGFVPVGAVAMTERIMDAVFNRIDRAVVHGSTFSKNNMAMAAALATITLLEEERLIENAARQGEALLSELRALIPRYPFLKEVRGRGLMIGIEFGKPESLKLKAAWNLLEAAHPGLFSQMVVIPLFKEHRILSQVAGYGLNVVKFLPPLVISDEDRRWIVEAVEQVVAATHEVPGAVWDLGKTLASQALKVRRGA